MFPTLLTSLLLVCVVAGASPVSAQEEDDGKLKTVLIGLKARRNVDPTLAAAMTDVVHGELVTEAHRTVFSQDDLLRVLEFESDKAAIGCDTDSCLAEIASALNADRLVNGTMDKIGSNYFLVLAEIDALNIKPIARVQVKVPLDEDALIEGVAAATRKLLKKSARASGRSTVVAVGAKPAGGDETSSTDGDDDVSTDEDEDEDVGVGIATVTSVPEGIEVFYDGQSVGFTPVTLENLPAGEAIVEAKLDDGDPVPISVPVTANGTTNVTATLNVPDTVTASEMAEYDESSSSHSFWSFALMGAGCLLCGGGILGVLGGSAASVYVGQAGGVIGALAAIAGVAGCASGLGGFAYWLFLDPEPPRISDEPVHAVVIQTPDGASETRDVEANWQVEDADEAEDGAEPDGDAEDAESEDGDDVADDTATDAEDDVHEAGTTDEPPSDDEMMF